MRLEGRAVFWYFTCSLSAPLWSVCVHITQFNNKCIGQDVQMKLFLNILGAFFASSIFRTIQKMYSLLLQTILKCKIVGLWPQSDIKIPMYRWPRLLLSPINTLENLIMYLARKKLISRIFKITHSPYSYLFLATYIQSISRDISRGR